VLDYYLSKLEPAPENDSCIELTQDVRISHWQTLLLYSQKVPKFLSFADCTTVSELKEKILLKNQNTIVGVDEHQLKIWKVCAFELSNLNQSLSADKHYMSTKDLM
jgi:hypothetical protein